MDLQFTSIILLLVFLIPFLFMVWMNGKTSTHHKLPPGPRKIPLIGNLHNIVAKQIMNTHDLVFADRPEFHVGKIAGWDSTGIELSRYGDYWKQVRRISTLELLSAKKVRSFKSLREEEVSNMIQTISLKTGSPINLSEKISSLSYDIIYREAFGNKCKDKQMLISALHEGSSLAGGFSFEDLFPSLKLLHFIGGTKEKLTRIHKKIDTIFEEMIEEHRWDKLLTISNGYLEEDFLDVLLRVQQSGDLNVPLTTDSIKTVIA
ncbi:hypothetical protein MKX03_029217, partial [Papaver bracteatum]